MERYTTKFKLVVIKSVLEDEISICEAADKYYVDRSVVRKWVKAYQAHGKEGISKHYAKYTGEFKQEVVEYMLANKLSYRETTIKFNLGCHDVVSRWEQIYLEEGPEGLYKERRGGIPPISSKNKVKSALSNNVQEDLIAENRRLRIENDYLKKLNALVRERKLAERKKRPR